ncbi:MAG TPA: HAD-IA family hydrolase [Armatimonadota bacterium]
MHRFSAAFFDLGGTLVYRIVTQERVLRLLCEEMELALPPETDWQGAVAVWRAYHASHALSCRTLDSEQSLIRREAQLVLKSLTGGNASPTVVDRFHDGIRRSGRWWSVYDDVMPVLNYVKATGLTTGVISNWEPSLPDFVREMGLSHAFPVIVGSVEEGIEKPSPRLFELAMERAGVNPADALYVGDNYRSDVVGARAAGMTPVLLDRNDRYLSTDCLKVRALDEVIDILQGEFNSAALSEVCFSGFAL